MKDKTSQRMDNVGSAVRMFVSSNESKGGRKEAREVSNKGSVVRKHTRKHPKKWTERRQGLEEGSMEGGKEERTDDVSEIKQKLQI